MKPEEVATKENRVIHRKYTMEDTKSISYANLPLLDIPTIDIGRLSSSLSSEMEGEIKKLHSALSSSGYFQAVNHGMSTSFLDEVLQVGRTFFELPIEEKEKHSQTGNDPDGYRKKNTCQESGTNNGCFERLYHLVLPENRRKFEKWPQNPENLRRVLLEFTENLRMINEIILKAMAKSLNLEENCFLYQLGKNPSVLSIFSTYPPCPWSDLSLGLIPHSDGSATTYILQDKEVEGLQVLKNCQWHRVPLTPDAILFNVGDQVEIMTNGIFRSPIHRVATDKKKERISFGMFASPEPTSEITPAEGLIDDKNLRLYKNVIDYGRHCKQQRLLGRRFLDDLKI